MSQKAQKQKLLNMSVPDKKMMRLINCSNLTDKDVVFINNAYEQKQQIHFRYSIMFTGLSTVGMGFYFTKFSPTSTQFVFYCGLGLVQHMFWSAKATRRMESLLSPYFEKYQIK